MTPNISQNRMSYFGGQQNVLWENLFYALRDFVSLNIFIKEKIFFIISSLYLRELAFQNPPFCDLAFHSY